VASVEAGEVAESITNVTGVLFQSFSASLGTPASLRWLAGYGSAVADVVGEPSGIGIGAVSAAVTLMGIGSVVAKAADIDGPILGFHRAWGAAVAYGIVLLLMRGRFSVAKLRQAAPGGLIFGVQLALFFSSVQLTTVANATMLLALQPVVILLFFAKRFGETVHRREWVLSGLAIAGVGLVVFGSVDSPSWSPAGDALGERSSIRACHWCSAPQCCCRSP